MAIRTILTCSGVRFQPTAPTFCRSCSSLRAPPCGKRTFSIRRITEVRQPSMLFHKLHDDLSLSTHFFDP
jgi:hypothetical protein